MAKRISLREFQQNLSQRLTSAMAGETQRALLGFLAGREYWLTDLADSGEIVPLPPLTAVPLAKPWFRGIANIRGTLYNVVDLSAFQGGEPTPTGSDARLLLPNARIGVGSALLVNRALGLRSAESLEELAETPDARPWVAGKFGDSQGRVWVRLAFEALLAHPDFLDVAA